MPMFKKNAILELISTWFYSGLSPKAPGTCGSLATLPFVYILMNWQGINALLIFIVLVSIGGVFAADAYSKLIKKTDPGLIVIDEVAGQAIALIMAGTNLWLYAIGFALFRLFDITKPWPISWADEKVKGGLGIMLDDIFAGICAGLLVWIIKIYFF